MHSASESVRGLLCLLAVPQPGNWPRSLDPNLYNEKKGTAPQISSDN